MEKTVNKSVYCHEKRAGHFQAMTKEANINSTPERVSHLIIEFVIARWPYKWEMLQLKMPQESPNFKAHQTYSKFRRKARIGSKLDGKRGHILL